MKPTNSKEFRSRAHTSGAAKYTVGSMLVFFLFLVSSASAADMCPGEPRCTCKWSGGKNTVDCSNAGLTSLPNTLDPKYQTIVMDGNPLERLEKDVFKAAGLVNLQVIQMRNCHLIDVHEHAFRGLVILKEVDISSNNITKLRPKTFDGDNNLQIIKLSHNPIRQLEKFQFPPLNSLKKLDFSHCQIETIDTKTFQNLHGVESIFLNNNNLRRIYPQSLLPLQNTLKTLHLHGNEWVCDCKLQPFREWVIEKKLFNRPTQCMEPARLNGKMWNEIQKQDFACKPEIEIPFEVVFGGPGRNATLSCHVTGNPIPKTSWVINGRIVNNNTSPGMPFSDQRWLLFEETYAIHKWYNLTVTNAGYENQGSYVCVAENSGGVQEKTVTLTFDDPGEWPGNQPLSPDQWTVVIGAITASLVFLALLIGLICFCCVCKNQSKNAKHGMNNHNRANENGHRKNGITTYADGDQSQQRLLPPTPMVEQNSIIIPQCTHGYENNRTPSVISKPQSCTSTTDSSRASIENYDPDLIHHYTMHKKTSTPLSVSTLMSPHQLNGGHHRVSPFTRSGTLPIHYHHHHSGPRSVSCDHSSQHSSQTLRLTPQPPKQGQQQQQQHQKHSLQMQQRPGYVTLPRRPRSSWSAPPRESPTPSGSSGGQSGAATVYANMTMGRRREPVYDGVGPRTSADGSSMGTLPRDFRNNGHGSCKAPLGSPAGVSNSGKVSLGPYYAPIAEMEERDFKNQKSVDSNASELTLMEESISSYCEPFGKALPACGGSNGHSGPNSQAVTPTPLSSSDGGRGSKSRNSTSTVTSAESELEALIVAPGVTAPPPNLGTSAAQNGHSVHHNNMKNGDHIHKLEEDIPPMMPLLPPIMTSTQGIAETSFNESAENENYELQQQQNNKKVPPKTLPKPKVRPLPPPKPSKSSMLQRPVISFQDEGADGSEV